ncbi:helix-turn-helix transcriptional regulator, partial [Streptomyces sp. NPDC058611]|uniref:helix-turn-helix transcriptional regulator n=1 Tax=Streptomyces sp. NPDC058611 TaxID=3346554 RepID=UPI00365D7E71
MSKLFDAVDALVASRSPLPPPAERKRLRAAHGLTIDEVATALGVRRATVSAWESGRTEPRPPEREAYARLLRQLAELYPVPAAEPEPAPSADPVPAAKPEPAPAPAEAATRTPAAARGPGAAPPARPPRPPGRGRGGA